MYASGEILESPRGADLARSLTHDEYLVLQHLLSGNGKHRLSMTFQVVEIDDGLLVDGELDMNAADDFLEIAEATVDGTREVVLDIADLRFIDSAGVRAILQLAATSCPNGMVLQRPREGVQRVLDIGKIEDVPGIRVERRDA
jgi:anti-anti-sigma factor